MLNTFAETVLIPSLIMIFWLWSSYWHLVRLLLHCMGFELLRRRSKETSKLRVTRLCAGNSSLTGEFPAQRVRNADNVSIWWRHHGHQIEKAQFQQNSAVQFDPFQDVIVIKVKGSWNKKLQKACGSHGDKRVFQHTAQRMWSTHGKLDHENNWTMNHIKWIYFELFNMQIAVWYANLQEIKTALKNKHCY